VSSVERDRDALGTVRIDGGASHVRTAPDARPHRRLARRSGASIHRWAGGAELAIGLLTVLPVPRVDSREGELGRGSAWFPLVGALVGSLAGSVRMASQPLLGTLPATALALAALIAVTGALHQDGLADTADGIGARGDGGRRLAAMRDHAIGAFGVLALLWWGLVMLSALASMNDTHMLLALIVAGALSRWAAVAHASFSPPARTDGLGAAFHVSVPSLAVATIFAAAIAGLASGVLVGLGALGAAVLCAALSIVWARRSLGGRTGDTLGAAVAVAEVTVCLVLLAAWRG
jgi:adenosylcobinamide-GDP ribazoletransferase